MKLRGLVVTACILSLSGCTATSLPAATTGTVTSPATAVTTSVPTVTATPATTSTPSATAVSVVTESVACSQVRRRASDGERMLLTLGVGAFTTTYNLEYQFASVRPAPDLGEGAPGAPLPVVLVYGRQVPPSAGTADAISLRDFTATQLADCPGPAALGPAAFTGFLLPQGCSYVRAPVLAVDHSERAFDCPGGTVRAVETLAPAFTQQGWISCATGPGRGYWRKGATLIVVSQSANDNPLLVQYPGTTPCP